MDLHYKFNDKVYSLKATRQDSVISIEYDGSTVPVRWTKLRDNYYTLNIDGVDVRAVMEGEGAVRHVFLKGDIYQLEKVAASGKGSKIEEEMITGDLVAPLTGKVVKILAEEGETVEEKQPVMIVEAMKMEHKLRAPFNGTVEKVHVAPGDMVQGGDLLIQIDEA